MHVFLNFETRHFLSVLVKRLTLKVQCHIEISIE